MNNIKHIEHFEDAVIATPVLAQLAITQLIWQIRNGKGNVSKKVDGSPAVVFGLDRADNPQVHDPRLWVSTKSFFNKNPLKFYSVKDIEESGKDEEVKAKLKTLFKALRPGELDLSYIYTGDLLWAHPSDWAHDDYNHTISVTPNVVTYTFKLEDVVGKKVGIAIHPEFYKARLGGMQGKGDDSRKLVDLKKSKNIHVVDLDFYGSGMDELVRPLQQLWTILSGGNSPKNKYMYVPSISSDLLKYYKSWRVAIALGHAARGRFPQFVRYKIKKHIETLKTQAAKDRWLEKADAIILEYNKVGPTIDPLYDWASAIKEEVINKFDEHNDLQASIESRFSLNNPIKGGEGYVVDTGFGLIKLVRNEFKRANKSGIHR